MGLRNKMDNTITDKVVAEFIDARPGIVSKNALGRMLAIQYPQIFMSVKHATNAVLRVTGARGSASLKDGHPYYREIKPSKHGFPEPILYKPHAPYILPDEATNILAISDVHVPFQDQDAQDAAFDYGLEHKVNTIVLLGDIFDNHNHSHHLKDPRTVNVTLERILCTEWLANLRALFPDALIIYKLGNHEFRFERFWLDHPEMLDTPGSKFWEVYKFKELDIVYVHNKAQIHAKKFTMIHGHEFPRNMWGTSPKHPATSYWTKFQDNVIGADKHRTDNWSVRTGRGKEYEAWCLGCLCQLDPEYAATGNQWNHGFAHILIEPNGDFTVYNRRIINGKVR